MPPSLTPEQRSLRASIGAHTLHATHDSREVTAPARAAFNKGFENQVAPRGDRRRLIHPAESEG